VRGIYLPELMAPHDGDDDDDDDDDDDILGGLGVFIPKHLNIQSLMRLSHLRIE
jgi:hypothetical protein